MLAVNKEDAILFNIVVKNIFSSLQLDQKLIFTQANNLVGLCLVWVSSVSSNVCNLNNWRLKLDKEPGGARHLSAARPFQFLFQNGPYRIVNLERHCFDFE